MKDKKKLSNRIRLVLMQRVYVSKRHPWTIPIEKVGNGFITGQDLDLDKMIGNTPLTAEEKERYPSVINPYNLYKAVHHKWYDVDNDYENALVNLMIASRMIAKSKSSYDISPAKYVGYFFNELLEAESAVKVIDEKIDALKLIHDGSMEQFKRIALMLNYKRDDFNVNPEIVPWPVLKNKVYEVCLNNPTDIRECFEEYNHGVNQDIFILEAVDFGLLTLNKDRDFYYGREFLGSSLDEVKRILLKQDKEFLLNKLKALVKQKKSGIPIEKDSENAGQEFNFDKAYNRITTLIFEQKYEEAKNELQDLKIYSEMDKDNLIPKIEKVIDENFSEHHPSKYDDLPLDKLQSKIKHHMTKYDEEECKDFWDDKEKLLEYMKNIDSQN